MSFRFITDLEFRVAADAVYRFTNSDPTKTIAQEIAAETMLRANAKFILALYFEQIRLLCLSTVDDILDKA